MRIITNPGSNLSAAIERKFDLDLAQQMILVDGFPHDVRSGMTLASIDKWVERSKTHPQVQGTPVTGYLDEFRRLAKIDRELLVISTSRKIIGSHAAALEAREQVVRELGSEAPRIEAFDTQLTDVAAGLQVFLAAEARRAGLSLDEVLAVLGAFSSGGFTALCVDELDNLVKGGRASFLTAWVGNALNIRPVLALVDGVVARIGRYRRGADQGEPLQEQLAQRVKPGRKVWLAIAHGAVPEKAEAVRQRFEKAYDVAFSYVQPLSPSIYLHAGHGAMLTAVYPVDALPWVPTKPVLP